MRLHPILRAFSILLAFVAVSAASSAGTWRGHLEIFPIPRAAVHDSARAGTLANLNDTAFPVHDLGTLTAPEACVLAGDVEVTDDTERTLSWMTMQEDGQMFFNFTLKQVGASLQISVTVIEGESGERAHIEGVAGTTEVTGCLLKPVGRLGRHYLLKFTPAPSK